LKNKNSRSKKGISPAISTVIITAITIALVTVAMVFANNFLSARMAESDFNAAKQFMQTTGLQIDDVAWKIGQTETIRYSSKYATMSVLNATLSYSYNIYIKTSGNPNWQLFSSSKTGVILFNMPNSQYTISNSWYQLFWPSQTATLILNGSSAPTSKVFGVEKIPMSDGNFIRVVTAPMIRMINSNITIGTTNSTFYFRFYLPLVSLKSAPRISQSVTLTGNAISVKTQNRITSIKINMTFPQTSGFDNTFFNFPSVQQIINAPSGYPSASKDCVIELYTGAVGIELGAHA
jgi:FlaG/FlaF family flagellin (archaellin)